MTMFDIIEHVREPESFVRTAASRAKYLMVKTPMETTGEWHGAKPFAEPGETPDGHINFFTPSGYEKLLNDAGLEIVASHLVRALYPSSSLLALEPEHYETLARNAGLRLPNQRGFRHPKQMAKRALFRLHEHGVLPWRLLRKHFGGGDHMCLCRSRIAKA
ncbi:MAG TPA: methyltransferase domain-containing protein [Sedimentisphaerales bacterium]|nr:methyltransferase domain-containing protein [Sedimentisphaerales bacterium]